MKLSQALVCGCLLVLAAAAASAEPVETEYKHKHSHGHDHHGSKHHDDYDNEKKITLYADKSVICPDPGNTFPDLNCGEAVTITRNLYKTQEDATNKENAVAVLFQSGIVVTSGAQSGDKTGVDEATLARVVYQSSFRFFAPTEGTIQAQGDGTGPSDAAFTNRAIVGGTGAFTGVQGYITRGGDPVTRDPGPFVFVLTNGKSYGY